VNGLIQTNSGVNLAGANQYYLENSGTSFRIRNNSSGAVPVTIESGNFSNLLYLNSSGNVGIGTTSPWGLLSINPNGITGPSFVIGSSTATNFIVTNGGNVGIGTASPVSMLSVNGQVTLGSTATSTAATLGSLVWDDSSFYGKTGAATTTSTGWFNLAQDNTVDVFLIAGQSNAVGQGDSTLSPVIPTGKVLQYYQGSVRRQRF
jgi:hypothetical protein